MRFIYAEGAYFWRWWKEMTEEKHQGVKKLVEEGRLEFVGGGWTTNDEATTHYQSLIDQFTWGLRRLNDTFGPCGLPRVGWQIDLGGNFRGMASIFAQMGFDGTFFSNIDYNDRKNRLSSKTMEFIWEGSPNLGSAADLFTSVLYKGYTTPYDLCYDISCSDASLVDNKESPEYNVKPQVHVLMKYVNEQAPYYSTNNILIPLGGNFYFEHADRNFQNIDKIIRAVNEEHKEVNIIYSTPSCYLKAVNDAGKMYTRKYDDFFPLDNYDIDYWTGLYTARPYIKFYERFGNKFLQVGKQLVSMTELGQKETSSLDNLREAMGVMQHHQAITGNAAGDVIDDYVRLLSIGIEEAQGGVESAMRKLMSRGTRELDLHNCLLLNVSRCDVSEEEKKFVVTVYNPMSRKVSHFVRFPVPLGIYKVQDPQGKELKLQIIPIPESVLKYIPDRGESNANHELVFKAEDLPPLGFRSYYVTRVNDSSQDVTNSTDMFIGSNDTIMVVLDENSGLINEVIIGEITIPLKQNVYDNEDCKQQIYDLAEITVYKGDVVDEIHQYFSNDASQVVRIYKEDKYVELEWLVSPGVFNKVVSKFDTDLATNSLFYTDTNGRELLQRKRQNSSQTILANYYPVTSRIIIRDTKSELEVAVLNDRSQGGSSSNDGQIELMVHLKDRGDISLVRGKHILVVGNKNGPSPNLAAQERILIQKNNFSPWLFFTRDGHTFEKWQEDFKMEYSGLSKNLPKNIQILTLEPWREGELLLRLEHIMEKEEDPELSKSVQVNLEGLFSRFDITEIRETSLGGNQWLEDMQRLIWKSTSNRNMENNLSPIRNVPVVKLKPMEIRTFVIKVVKKYSIYSKQNNMIYSCDK